MEDCFGVMARLADGKIIWDNREALQKHLELVLADRDGYMFHLWLLRKFGAEEGEFFTSHTEEFILTNGLDDLELDELVTLALCPFSLHVIGAQVQRHDVNDEILHPRWVTLRNQNWSEFAPRKEEVFV